MRVYRVAICHRLFFFILTKDVCIEFRERGQEREREKERKTHVREKRPSVVSHMCPDQGSDPQTIGVWDDAPTEPRGQAQFVFLLAILTSPIWLWQRLPGFLSIMLLFFSLLLENTLWRNTFRG